MSLSGVFLYCNIARRKASLFKLPLAPTLSVSNLFTVLTPTSALQLLWAKATEDSLWWIPQSLRNLWVADAVNCGPPSEASSSGIPKVVNMSFKAVMRPDAPSGGFDTMGQLEYRSTITRKVLPLSEK